MAQVNADCSSEPLASALRPEHKRVDDQRHEHVERRRQHRRLDAAHGAGGQQNADSEHDENDRSRADDHDTARVAHLQITTTQDKLLQ